MSKDAQEFERRIAAKRAAGAYDDTNNEVDRDLGLAADPAFTRAVIRAGKGSPSGASKPWSLGVLFGLRR